MKAKLGWYEFKRLGQIMCIRVCGTLNDEEVDQYKRDVGKALAPLVGRPWGVLLQVEGMTVLTPYAEREFIKMVSQRKDYGMLGTAVVTGEAAIPLLIRQQLTRIYQGHGFALAFFDSDEAALEWLQQLGCQTGY